MTQMKKVKVTI